MNKEYCFGDDATVVGDQYKCHIFIDNWHINHWIPG